MNASRTPVAELVAWWLWPGVVAAALLAAGAAGPGSTGPAVPLALALATSGGVVLLYAHYARPAVTRVPAADRITFARVGLTCAVAGFVGERLLLDDPAPPGLLLAAVAGLSAGLDALDGYVARRRGQTRHGARFDLESDAWLLMVLSAALAPSLGAWVLAIGAIRYAFWLAGFALPWLRGELGASRARKAVAAAQAIALLVAATGLPPIQLSRALCGLALAALSWSFGRDIWSLWRARPAAEPVHRVSPRGLVALKVGTGAAILAALGLRLGTDAFTAGLAALTPATVAWALLIGLVTTLASALRWMLIARRFGVRLRPGEAVRAYYRSLFLNAALPAGVLGDAERAVRHGVASGAPGAAARAVVVERLVGQVALWVVTAAVFAAPSAASPWERATVEPTLSSPDVRLILALVIPLVLVLGAAVAVLRRPGGGWWRRDLRSLLTLDTWPTLAGLSIVVLTGHVAMFAVAADAVGTVRTDAPLATLLPLFLLALVAMSVPANIGGFGPREGVAAWSFGAAGLGASLGVSIAVAYGALAFVASLPGLGVWLSGRRATLTRQDRRTNPQRGTRRPRERTAA